MNIKEKKIESDKTISSFKEQVIDGSTVSGGGSETNLQNLEPLEPNDPLLDQNQNAGVANLDADSGGYVHTSTG